jgi:hypothetical protein
MKRHWEDLVMGCLALLLLLVTLFVYVGVPAFVLYLAWLVVQHLIGG